MTDLEKTIAGLSVVKARMEFYRHASAKVVGDALALLKEQQKQIEEAYNKGFDDGQKNILEAQAE